MNADQSTAQEQSLRLLFGRNVRHALCLIRTRKTTFTSCLYFYQLNDRNQYKRDMPRSALDVLLGAGSRHSLIVYISIS
jgi:hypothetical protein